MKTSATGQQPDGAACDIAELLEPRFFKALCDPNRLEMIIHLLHCGTPQTVSHIAESSHVDISVVSRHLAMLRDVGILTAQRRGKEVYYSVRTGPLVQTLRAMADALEACCPSAAEEKGESQAPEAVVQPSKPAAAAPRRRMLDHVNGRPAVERTGGEGR